jgi:hypothetical protein
MSERTCKYCLRVFLATDAGYQENPFCTRCIDARLSAAAQARGKRGVPKLTSDGRYVITYFGDEKASDA